MNILQKPSLQNAPSNLAALGWCILPSEVFDILENITPGVGNEIQLTDALLELQVQEGLNAVMTDASIYDCGNKRGFLGANLAIGMQDPKTRENIYSLLNKFVDNDF